MSDRKKNAEAVLAQLRALGPQTAAQIQDDLRITKRETEDALYLLQAHARVEMEWPTRSPLVYVAASGPNKLHDPQQD